MYLEIPTMTVAQTVSPVCETPYTRSLFHKPYKWERIWVLPVLGNAEHDVSLPPERHAGGSLLDEFVMLWHLGGHWGKWPTEQLFSSEGTPLSPGSEKSHGLTWTDWVLPMRAGGAMCRLIILYIQDWEGKYSCTAWHSEPVRWLAVLAKGWRYNWEEEWTACNLTCTAKVWGSLAKQRWRIYSSSFIQWRLWTGSWCASVWQGTVCRMSAGWACLGRGREEISFADGLRRGWEKAWGGTSHLSDLSAIIFPWSVHLNARGQHLPCASWYSIVLQALGSQAVSDNTKDCRSKNQSGLPRRELEAVAWMMHVIPDEITHLQWLSPALQHWELSNCLRCQISKSPLLYWHSLVSSGLSSCSFGLDTTLKLTGIWWWHLHHM